MGRRNTGRKLAMQVMYQAELRDDEIDSVISDYLKSSSYMKETLDWAIELSTSAWGQKSELDLIITDLSVGWSIDRINPIDKNLLRIALYEINYSDIDAKIILNEVIEIAKKYSTDDSPKFINGILGTYVERGDMQHVKSNSQRCLPD